MLIVILVTILTFFVIYGPQPLLPLMAKTFDLTSSEAALLITTTMFPLSLAPITYGYVLEAVPAVRLLRLSVLALGLSTIVFGLANSFPALVGLRFIQGLLLPAVLTSLMTYLSKVREDHQLQRVISIYIAATISGGYLQREGLEPHYEVATPKRTIPDCIRKGEAHLAQMAVAVSFPELERGDELDIVHFAQINERDGFFIAGREPDSDFRWEKLVGREVLVDHLFQPLAMLRYLLHQRGVDYGDLHAVDAGDVEAMDSAFRGGRGDYVHQQGPAPQQLAHDGLGYPVASVGEEIGPVAFSSLCASREWLQSDMAAAFMGAYRRARADFMEMTAVQIAERVAGHFPTIDRQVLEGTIGDYQRLGCWSVEADISRSAYKKLLDVFLHSGLISRRHPYESCVVTLDS